MFDPLPDDLAAAIGSAADRLAPFDRIRYAAEVESTNDVAMTLAISGEPEGTSVLADAQRHGRGRRGRDWFSPPGAGLYLSVIARPLGGAIVPLITLAAGVATARAVRAVSALPVELKWPNDLVIGRPWRKLGGILCEAVGAGATADAVIIGIGVNLLGAAYPREIADRAASLESELGRPIERAPLVVALLDELRVALAMLHASRHDVICESWRDFGRNSLGAAPVRWRDHETLRRGRVRDIDRDGALLVETDDGVERIVGGEVFWEGLSREP